MFQSVVVDLSLRLCSRDQQTWKQAQWQVTDNYADGLTGGFLSKKSANLSHFRESSHIIANAGFSQPPVICVFEWNSWQTADMLTQEMQWAGKFRKHRHSKIHIYTPTITLEGAKAVQPPRLPGVTTPCKVQPDRHHGKLGHCGCLRNRRIESYMSG